MTLYFVSPGEQPWRQRVFRKKMLVNARATCVFSHAFKKEHWDWRIKDASCSVYSWTRPVTSRSFSGWDKVYIYACFLYHHGTIYMLFLLLLEKFLRRLIISSVRNKRIAIMQFSTVLLCTGELGTICNVTHNVRTCLKKLFQQKYKDNIDVLYTCNGVGMKCSTENSLKVQPSSSSWESRVKFTSY